MAASLRAFGVARNITGLRHRWPYDWSGRYG
jgi:hypothetical protein